MEKRLMKPTPPLRTGATFLVAAVLLVLPATARSVERFVEHPVQPFAILATEATVADFAACREAGKCDLASVDSSCNVGRPGLDDHPVNCITHDGAAALCAHLGGRLCTSKEWLAACRGSDNRAFPYGPEFHPSRCHVGSYENPGPGGKQTMPVGSIPECQGGLEGVFDLSGNVSEWMADCKDDYCKFRGAAYVGNEPVEHFAGCGEVCSGNKPSLKSGTVGVRCCRDRQP
jgi:formylglycine-generating enzyme required for sulfatase activity